MDPLLAELMHSHSEVDPLVVDLMHSHSEVGSEMDPLLAELMHSHSEVDPLVVELMHSHLEVNPLVVELCALVLKVESSSEESTFEQLRTINKTLQNKMIAFIGLVHIGLKVIVSSIPWLGQN